MSNNIIRTAKGKYVDFDALRERASNMASQEAESNESSGLARPEDTYIPPEAKPKKRVKPAETEEKAATPKPNTTSKTKKRSESDVAEEILKDLE